MRVVGEKTRTNKSLRKISTIFRCRLLVCVIMGILFAYNIATVVEAESEYDWYQVITEIDEANQTEARAMLELINEFRQGENAWFWADNNTDKIVLDNLQPLTWDYNLEQIAIQRAIEASVAFTHGRPDDSAEEVTYNGTFSYGECLSKNLGRSAEEALRAFQEENNLFAEQGHRRLLLSSQYTAIGIGFVMAEGTPYWAIEFGISNSNAAPTTAYNGTIRRDVRVNTKEWNQPGGIIVHDGPISIGIGESVELPDVKFYAFHPRKSRESESTLLPKNYYELRWRIGETNTAVIENNRIVGLHAGAAHLEASFVYKIDEYTYMSDSLLINVLTNDLADTLFEARKCTDSDGNPIGGLDFILSYNGQILQNGKDYQLDSSTLNQETGEVTVVYKGIGDYSGIKEGSYWYMDFMPGWRPDNSYIDLSGVTVSKISDQIYTGKPITPKVVVTLNGKTLTEGKEYVINYFANISPGRGNCEITGIGDYTGRVSVYFNIVEAGTPTKSPTVTPMVKVTNSPTPTLKPSPTGIQTPTPSISPDITENVTITPSEEVSITPTDEPDISDMPTVSAEPTPTATPQLSPTPTLKPTEGMAFSATPSPEPMGSLNELQNAENNTEANGKKPSRLPWWTYLVILLALIVVIVILTMI
ncbi:MAG: hypothetical protein K6F26_00885 [Lachnospiraceae bacterium]|nr:hypothetical protein [Lachnospiraceae bacterium]